MAAGDFDEGLRICFASQSLERICRDRRKGTKELGGTKAFDALMRVLEDLSSLATLGEIPVQATPLHFHALRGDRSGEYAVRIDAKRRLCFRPAGEFELLPDGSPSLESVTEIEVTFVGDYHP